MRSSVSIKTMLQMSVYNELSDITKYFHFGYTVAMKQHESKLS